jgi:type IV pilus assembly protein PilV
MLKKHSGYIMIETLVTIIVFSVAMIALLALQSTALGSSQSANYRSMASNYAYDLIDKMRSNHDAVASGAYIGAAGADNSCRNLNYNTLHASAATCTSAQMAQDDLKEFFAEVSNLPNGAAVVCLDASRAQGTPTAPNCDGTSGSYAIKVFWKDTRSQLLGTNSGYSQVIIGVVQP